MFDKWSANSGEPKEQPVKWKCKEEPVIKYDRKIGETVDLNLFKSYSLPTRRHSRSFEKYLDAWSKGLLAEFNTIIQDDRYHGSDNAESADDDYDEVAPDSSDDDCTSMRMKYTINKDDYRASPTVSPSTSEHSSGSSGNSRLTPPYISRIVKNKQRSQIASVHNKRDPVLVNVKIYPNEQPKLPEVRRTEYEYYNGHVSIHFVR